MDRFKVADMRAGANLENTPRCSSLCRCLDQNQAIQTLQGGTKTLYSRCLPSQLAATISAESKRRGHSQHCYIVKQCEAVHEARHASWDELPASLICSVEQSVAEVDVNSERSILRMPWQARCMHCVSNAAFRCDRARKPPCITLNGST